MTKARTGHNQPTSKISQESQDYFPNRKQTYALLQQQLHSLTGRYESLQLPPYVLRETVVVLSNCSLLTRLVLDVSKATDTLTQNATRGAKDILSTELITLKAKYSTLPDNKTLKITVATSKTLTH